MIRRALTTDATAVGHIHVESWNVAYRGIMPDDVIAKTDLAYRTRFWAEPIADREWPVFLIEEEGKALAFCQMIPSRDLDDDPTRVGHITSLHVLPHLRGRGYGRVLVDYVLDEFPRGGSTRNSVSRLMGGSKCTPTPPYPRYGIASRLYSSSSPLAP